MAHPDGRNSPAAGPPDSDPGAARRPHSIRFSDSEWTLIEDAALRHGVSAGEIVRSGALAAAGRRLDEAAPAALAPGHLTLIEATFRMVYATATLRRNELRAAGHEKQLEKLVAEAREVMTETMEDSSA